MMAVTAIVGAGVVGAGASLGGAAMQAGAANNATSTQYAMYEQMRQDLMPYMNLGNSALPMLQSLMGLGPGGMSGALSTLQNYPGYQWAVGQGQQALDRSAASRGLELSGGQLKDTEAYGQGMADQLFGTYFGQLSGLAGMGENAAAGVGSAGVQTGQGMAATQMQAGNAWAGGLSGASNQIGGILGAYAYNPSMFGSTDQTANIENWMNTYDSGLDLGGTLSDRRAKTDIQKIGKLDSGLPVYSYRFKGSMLPRIGVMAQDVEKVAPHAVSVDRRSGLKRVDQRAVSQLPPLKRAA